MVFWLDGSHDWTKKGEFEPDKFPPKIESDL